MIKVTVEATEVYYVDDGSTEEEAKEKIREGLLLGGDELKNIQRDYWAHNEGDLSIECDKI